MDGFFALLFLGLGLAFLAAPVLAIIAIVRINRLRLDQQQRSFNAEMRLTNIEKELLAVRQHLEKIDEQLATTAPSATPTVTPSEPQVESPPPPVETKQPPAQPPPPAEAEQPPAQSPPPIEARQPPAPPRSTPTPPSHVSAKAPARPPMSATGVEAPPLTMHGTPPPPPPAEGRPAVPPSAGPPSGFSVQIDWERWVGIRGAAVLGAVALGLAGLLFFKYSIEHGLITPSMRVVFGTATGIGCLLASEWLRPRNYRYTAEAITGAGVLILYAAFWSAHVLYGLIGMTPAFGLMILVTVTCCLLALRRHSLVIAVLGLVGGFATPLLLSSGADRPLGLFGYVLLLDLGLLTLGHKRRWPSLGILSLLGTVLLQALWIGARMGPDRLPLGLGILALFGALFAISGRYAGDGESRRLWQWNQIGAISFPFIFALYFAGRVELGVHLYPIAILLALLSAAAGWIARGQRNYAVSTGAAAASVAVVGVWLLQHSLTPALAWEAMAVMAGLAAIFHLFVELEPGRHLRDGPSLAAIAAACGFFTLSLFSGGAAPVAPWPWLAGWALLTGMLYRHATLSRLGELQVAGAIGLGAGLSILHLWPRPILPSPELLLALLVATPLALHVAALRRAPSALRELANHAAALLPLLLLLGLFPVGFMISVGPLLALGTILILGVLVLLAATRLGSGLWYGAAVGGTLVAQFGWTWNRPGLREDPAEALTSLIIEMVSVAVFTVWPLLVPRRFLSARLAWYAAALAGPLWFWTLRHLFEWRFGDGFIGVLPVALGALTLVAAHGARKAFSTSEPVRLTALVWFAAVALCFLAVAIPLQLEKEWITIGWALEALAVIALWKRLDHPGLKYFGLALLGATTVRLVANPALLGYYSPSAWPIVNWLLYTYLVPAAAMLGSAAILRPHEASRARTWESGVYSRGQAMGAIGSVLAAIVVIFVWINLAIADWFATGPALTLSFGETPAQRLTVSIAWAVYALVLLGFGMSRDSLGLRWLSLGFLLATIGKVFLYDLGALKDLYRVASLVGLSVSLILVSLLYQRFVFRKRKMEGT
jgi:uncharacterized membrane protein